MRISPEYAPYTKAGSKLENGIVEELKITCFKSSKDQGKKGRCWRKQQPPCDC